MTLTDRDADVVSFNQALDEFSQIIPIDRGAGEYKLVYESRPPVFANLDDLIDTARTRAQQVLFRSRAVLPAARILRLDNARVAERGAVITKNDQQILETLLYGRPVDVATVPEREFRDFTVLLRKPGDGNYGHWLIEMCSRISEYRRAYPADDWKVAIPYHPQETRGLRQRTLQWLGIDRDRIVWLTGTTTRFHDLAFITSNSVHSHTHAPEGIRSVRNAALNTMGNTVRDLKKGRRFFLCRDPNRFRALLNEAEILEICKGYGFEAVRPERLSIDEQVCLFSSAECIMGVSGAALTNILFAPQGCKILSLNPNHGPEFFFWDIANILGQEFSYIFGPVVDPERSVHSAFRVDAQLVADWLKEQVGAQ